MAVFFMHICLQIETRLNGYKWVYLHWLVKALGKEHGNTPYALDCVKNQEERPVLNWHSPCRRKAVLSMSFLPTASISLSKSPDSSFFMLSSMDSSVIFSYASKTEYNRRQRSVMLFISRSLSYVNVYLNTHCWWLLSRKCKFSHFKATTSSLFAMKFAADIQALI